MTFTRFDTASLLPYYTKSQRTGNLLDLFFDRSLRALPRSGVVDSDGVALQVHYDKVRRRGGGGGGGG